jgi:hypothetical protein
VLPSAAEIQAFTARMSGASASAMTDAERIDFLRAAEELKCVLEGAQAEVSVAFDASQRAEQARAGVRAERQGRGVAAQIALTRRVSHHRGKKLLHLATRLQDLPETRDALRAGRITEFKASIIARDTECLSPDLRARVDLAIAGDPEWLESLGSDSSRPRCASSPTGSTRRPSSTARRRRSPTVGSRLGRHPTR